MPCDRQCCFFNMAPEGINIVGVMIRQWNASFCLHNFLWQTVSLSRGFLSRHGLLSDVCTDKKLCVRKLQVPCLVCVRMLAWAWSPSCWFPRSRAAALLCAAWVILDAFILSYSPFLSLSGHLGLVWNWIFFFWSFTLFRTLKMSTFMTQPECLVATPKGQHAPHKVLLQNNDFS